MRNESGPPDEGEKGTLSGRWEPVGSDVLDKPAALSNCTNPLFDAVQWIASHTGQSLRQAYDAVLQKIVDGETVLWGRRSPADFPERVPPNVLRDIAVSIELEASLDCVLGEAPYLDGYENAIYVRRKVEWRDLSVDGADIARMRDESGPTAPRPRTVSRAPDPPPQIPYSCTPREPKQKEPAADADLEHAVWQCGELINAARPPRPGRRWKFPRSLWDVEKKRWPFYRKQIDEGVARCGLSDDPVFRRKIDELDHEWKVACELRETLATALEAHGQPVPAIETAQTTPDDALLKLATCEGDPRRDPEKDAAYLAHVFGPMLHQAHEAGRQDAEAERKIVASLNQKCNEAEQRWRRDLEEGHVKRIERITERLAGPASLKDRAHICVWEVIEDRTAANPEMRAAWLDALAVAVNAGLFNEGRRQQSQLFSFSDDGHVIRWDKKALATFRQATDAAAHERKLDRDKYRLQRLESVAKGAWMPRRFIARWLTEYCKLSRLPWWLEDETPDDLRGELEREQFAASIPRLRLRDYWISKGARFPPPNPPEEFQDYDQWRKSPERHAELEAEQRAWREICAEAAAGKIAIEALQVVNPVLEQLGNRYPDYRRYNQRLIIPQQFFEQDIMIGPLDPVVIYYRGSSPLSAPWAYPVVILRPNPAADPSGQDIAELHNGDDDAAAQPGASTDRPATDRAVADAPPEAIAKTGPQKDQPAGVTPDAGRVEAEQVQPCWHIKAGEKLTPGEQDVFEMVKELWPDSPEKGMHKHKQISDALKAKYKHKPKLVPSKSVINYARRKIEFVQPK